MVAYLLRLELPDIPGTLGAVATAFGRVGADILAMDVVERTPGRAVDDIVVDLPNGKAPDVLITAGESVAGVHVESVRPDPGVASAHREWELVEALAAQPNSTMSTLAEMLPEVLRVGWAVVGATGDDHWRTIADGGGAPDLAAVTPTDLNLPGAIDPQAAWVPEDWRIVDTHLAAATIRPGVVVIVGRPGGPALRDVEVARLAHLASLAGAVSAPAGASTVPASPG